MIVRCAQLASCEYELRNHYDLAVASGVTHDELAAVSRWRESDHFAASERAGLALAEAMTEQEVPDEVLDDIDRHFTPSERVELIVTAALYCVVPRVVSALRLPLEDRHK
jgi:alkylhydroperoxidase family enzyme